jgi:dihydroflavonol-4-reductase
MTVVVTGATGHVGANLVRMLLERGDAVRVLVRDRVAPIEGLELERIRGDVRDPDSLRRALAGADVVYHCAAVISIDGDRKGLVPAVNVGGARNVAEAALACGVRRMVHVSSVHAFESEPLDRPLDETRERVSRRDRPAYDRSKAAGEAAVREVVAKGLDAVILHPTGVIGPCDHEPSRMGRVFLDLAHGRLPSLVDGGFDWVDVRDVARTAIAAAERGRTGESYLVSGNWHAVRELADMVEAIAGYRAPRIVAPMWLARIGAPAVVLAGRVLGKEPLYTSESLAALRANKRIVRTKAAKELDHVPRPTEETIADVYAWFERAGMLARRPKG